MKVLAATAFLVVIAMTTALQCYKGRGYEHEVPYDLDVLTCPEEIHSCFRVTAYLDEGNAQNWGCGYCHEMRDMFEHIDDNTSFHCMECSTSYCNPREETNGAEHLAISSLFLVLPAVLLY